MSVGRATRARVARALQRWLVEPGFVAEGIAMPEKPYSLIRPWDGTIPTRAHFEPTPSGHRARGELEDMVDVLCKTWLVRGTADPEMPELCTVEWIAGACTGLDGRYTSSGAVRDVLARWRDIGYAMFEQDPLRFVGLTADGVSLGRAELYRRRHYP